MSDYYPTILFVILRWNFYKFNTQSNIHGDAPDESEILSVDNIFKMIKVLEDLDR